MECVRKCRAAIHSAAKTSAATTHAPDAPVLTEGGRRRGLRLFAVVVVAWLPALVGHDAVQSAAALFPLAESPHPYFVPGHAGLLYLWTPLVVASACLLFLSPGLFLALAFDAPQSIGESVVYALPLSMIAISSVAGVVQAMMGSPLCGGAFAAVVVACALAGCGCWLVRLPRRRAPVWPLDEPYARATVLSMVAGIMLCVMALAPKFYWDSFNEDGADVYESARLLLVQAVPFWPRVVGPIASAGGVAEFPGINSMLFAFPVSWFIRLFGEVEAAARLPFLLFLVALYAGVLAVAQHGRAGPFGLAERWLMWLGLAVYTVVMAFSATYSPYTADVASPAVLDTLTMACFLGFVLAFLQRRRVWTCLFLGLTFISYADGLLLVGLWLVAVALIWKPRPWRQLALVVAAALGCLLVGAAAPRMLAVVGLPVPGSEFGVRALIRRFALLRWDDWRRVLFVVVPGGIFPAFALAAWRRQDQVSRALTLTTLAYFVLFYFQAHVALHHFVPPMLLPLVVFWRWDVVASPRTRRLLLGGCAAAGIAALLLSLPQTASLDTIERRVGATIEDRIEGYDRVDPLAFRRSRLLRYLFPVGWDRRVPFDSYGASHLVLNYYAHRTSGDRHLNYVMQPAADAAPAGMRLVADEDDVALYVRSDEVWASQLALRPATPAGSGLYVIPRAMMFRALPAEEGSTVIDVRVLLQRAGIDASAILGRLP